MLTFTACLHVMLHFLCCFILFYFNIQKVSVLTYKSGFVTPYWGTAFSWQRVLSVDFTSFSRVLLCCVPENYFAMCRSHKLLKFLQLVHCCVNVVERSHTLQKYLERQCGLGRNLRKSSRLRTQGCDLSTSFIHSPQSGLC